MSNNPLYIGLMNGFRPDPRYLVSEWMETNFTLSTATSAEPGKYKFKRVPYAKEIADSCSPQVRGDTTVVMKGTQLGLSTIGDGVTLTYLDIYTCPILYLCPTESLAKNTSKLRIDPAIRSAPDLLSKITNARGSDVTGSVYFKEVAGGGITFGWSNSTAALRSFSARLVILDDVDGYGEFGEGNVLELGKARADAMANRMIYINSTPTLAGYSNIENEFEESDQREYFMPCPHCNELINFEWENFIFEHDNYILKGDVKYSCKHCGGLIEEYEKTKMMAEENGAKWIPQKQHYNKGYLVPSFLSPVGWLSWEKIVRQFLKAKKALNRGDYKLMMVWYNTRLARPYKMKLDGVEIENADDRVEVYGCQVPDEVMVITAGIDTQDDRVEIGVIGHGKFGEIYYIDYKVIAGDIKYQATKDALDDYLINTEFHRADGNVMKIFGAGQDIGGHRTKAVFEYLKNKIPNKIFGIKGSSQINAPIVNKTVYELQDGARNLFILGVNAIKDDFYARLEVTEPGANYVHFPKLDIFDKRFFKMLTAEKRGENGKYVKVRTRNEAIDCTVYAIGVLSILDINVNELESPLIYRGEVQTQTIITKPNDDEDGIDDYLDDY